MPGTSLESGRIDRVERDLSEAKKDLFDVKTDVFKIIHWRGVFEERFDGFVKYLTEKLNSMSEEISETQQQTRFELREQIIKIQESCEFKHEILKLKSELDEKPSVFNKPCSKKKWAAIFTGAAALIGLIIEKIFS